MNKIKKFNKIKFNKKGEGSGFGWVAGAFGLLLAVFLGWMLFGRSSDAIKSTDVFLSLTDYDGDGAKDVMDACPCGTNNNLEEINGKAWCLAGLTQDQCGCADSFANSAMKSTIKKYNQEAVFIWNAESGKCLYMKDKGCKYLVYADNNNLPNTVQSNGCTQIP